jgi:hypothetical protein
MTGNHDRGSRRRPLLVLAIAAGLAAGAGCGGQDDTRPATWNYISTAIIQPGCATANCHSLIAQRSGVRLDQVSTGWDSLVTRNFVIPGDPAASSLMSLLQGEGTRRMPPDYPLASDDIDLISRWIMGGANK